MAVEGLDAAPRLDVPEPDDRVERGRGENGRAGDGTPFNGVNFLGVRAQIEHVLPVGGVERPDFGRVIVRARGQEPPLVVPPDGIDLVRVAGEPGDGVRVCHRADSDRLIRRARRKHVFVAPVHVEHGRLVDGVRLQRLARRHVPDDRGPVDSAREEPCAVGRPPQRKDELAMP
eukprot:Amastigsp_a183913_8.p2 type:complete len:174 gc:universal Amastigsp_a183913_8:1117-596(-)